MHRIRAPIRNDSGELIKGLLVPIPYIPRLTGALIGLAASAVRYLLFVLFECIARCNDKRLRLSYISAMSITPQRDPCD